MNCRTDSPAPAATSSLNISVVQGEKWAPKLKNLEIHSVKILFAEISRETVKLYMPTILYPFDISGVYGDYGLFRV